MTGKAGPGNHSGTLRITASVFLAFLAVMERRLKYHAQIGMIWGRDLGWRRVCACLTCQQHPKQHECGSFLIKDQAVASLRSQTARKLGNYVCGSDPSEVEIWRRDPSAPEGQARPKASQKGTPCQSAKFEFRQQLRQGGPLGPASLVYRDKPGGRWAAPFLTGKDPQGSLALVFLHTVLLGGLYQLG